MSDSVSIQSELQNNNFFRRQGTPAANGDDTVGDFDSLKQMLTDNSALQNYLIKCYQYIIARYDVDGFRIDTLRYLKGNLAQLFGNSIREYALSLGKKNFFTFGEVLGGNSEDEIAQFIGKNTQMGNDPNSLVGVDAALDYPLFFVIVSMLKGFSPVSSVVGMYHNRKITEQYILSSHGDASRYFVTFLDNHDMKRRFRWVQPGNPNEFDNQVSMGFACLYCLPGIPALYYGTEQGLHGYDDSRDPAVREALWGIDPDFPKTNPFYIELAKIAAVRDAQAAIRYGRFYFRPISGDAVNFGISTFSNGVIAWSRILNDEEVIIVANTSTSSAVSVYVILEVTLSTPGQTVGVLYTNKTPSTSPSIVTLLNGVTVQEVDGSISHGPLNVTRITLLPMEVQILRGEN